MQEPLSTTVQRDTATSDDTGISRDELKAAFSLGGIFGLRMLGLFMILPVFTLYAEKLQGNTHLLAGIAIGAYGLTQAVLQIPFGMLSDRIGRKPVIIGGLLIFALGSIIAASADSIYGVIAGRAMQGMGAIAAAVTALLADLTRERHRTKAMAIFGGAIGMSFTLALVLGPVLNNHIGVPGIFWLTAGLAIAAIAVTRFVVPQPRESHFHRDVEPIPALFGRVLRNRDLLRLDFGILSLHLLITASFVTLPLVLRDTVGMAAAQHWQLYLPVLLLSVATSLPFVYLADKRQQSKPLFLLAIGLIGLAELGLAGFHDSLWQITPLLFLFFSAFNLLEALLPALVSRTAPQGSRGTAMGVYNSSQFLGAFLGGAIGGAVFGRYGAGGVFAGGATLAFLWLAVAAGMKVPARRG